MTTRRAGFDSFWPRPPSSSCRYLSTNGPFLSERGMASYLLAAADDELLGPLVVTGLEALGLDAPRRARVTTTGAAAFAAAHRVIDGVHRRRRGCAGGCRASAGGRPCPTGCCRARCCRSAPMVARQSMWTRRISPEGMRSVAQSPSFAISVTLVPAERPTCAPRPTLSSTAWMSVPTGMKRSGSAVARLDVGGVRRDDLVADGEALRREDVRLLAVRVLDQRDARRAVRVVLDPERRSAGTPVLLRLKSILR